MENKILIFGKNGQLGSALQDCKIPGAIFLDEHQADFLNYDSIVKLIHCYKPSIVINAAAYTAVDKAETEKEICMQINALTPSMIAQTCAQLHIPFIHYSSDYVFSGTGEVPWEETSPPSPLNYYGESKLLSEILIKQSGCQFYILRTSWVYSFIGNNFVKTMLRLLSEKESLSIVSDQIGAPTYAPDLARATLQILHQLHTPAGIYHVCNQGETSWYKFALEIKEQVQKYNYPVKTMQIIPILTKDYKTAAKRPLNSRLNTEKFRSTFAFTLPTWESSLQNCVERLLSPSVTF